MINSITNKTNTIFLTGFMGSGKTTIGRALANHLKYEFIDLDTVIQIGEGMTISAIFKNRNESYFRNIESAYLKALPFNINTVIALGGGSYINEENQDYINSHGTSIFIDVPFEVIWHRLKSNNYHRPLANYMDKNMLKSLYDLRYPSYLNSHKHFIFKPEWSIKQQIEYILKLLN